MPEIGGKIDQADPLFQAVAQQLQIHATVDDYAATVTTFLDNGPWLLARRDRSDPTVGHYFSLLPTYTVARCPLCGQVYREAVDTYSLALWHLTPYHDQMVFQYAPLVEACNHRIGQQAFVNLRGKLPLELRPVLHRHTFGCLNGDRPFLLPAWMPDDLRGQAVIHSLPICSIIQDRFVPSYIVYVITYYAEDPKEVTRRYSENYPYPNLDYGSQLEDPSILKKHPEWADLTWWVRRGKLTWLDPYTPELPLRRDDTGFPYGEITGYGTGYIFYDPPLEAPWWAFWKRMHMREGGYIWLQDHVGSDLVMPLHPRLKKW